MEIGCKTPATIAEHLSTSVCVKKVNASFMKLAILGFLAGAYIAFGAQFATMVTHDLAAYLGVGFAKLIGGAVFSVGLMLVVIAGAELFTGNNLIFLSTLDGNTTVGGLLRNWLIVYLSNFIGSVFIVLLMYWTQLWRTNDMGVAVAAVKIANAKVNLPFMAALSRGILCNWLVCLAVWMSFASREVVGKIFAIFFPIMAFVASGFEHSVANMYFIPMGMVLKGVPQVAEKLAVLNISTSNLNLYGFVVRNLLPVTIGNIIGGAFFVATLYWFVYCKDKS